MNEEALDLYEEWLEQEVGEFSKYLEGRRQRDIDDEQMYYDEVIKPQLEKEDKNGKV